jgi:hypothetical protein
LTVWDWSWNCIESSSKTGSEFSTIATEITVEDESIASVSDAMSQLKKNGESKGW